MRRLFVLVVLASSLALLAFGLPPGAATSESTPTAAVPSQQAGSSVSSAEVAVHPQREAYFGDLHVHTALSIDAFITGTRTLPDDAYRYAKGEPIDHISGEKIRLQTPLDFMGVTDHSEILGVAEAMADPGSPLSKNALAPDITSTDFDRSQAAFQRIVLAGATGTGGDLIDPEQAATAVLSAWQRVIEAAERHYEPGRFTTFVAYEWTSMPQLSNLHRNVVFRGTDVPPVPFSSLDSNRPEDLWAHLEAWRQEGDDAIAIPHNSNASRGLMYALEDSDGEPLDADYARTRMKNEPVTELVQTKGTSETHPVLSPLDELAPFELWGNVVGARIAVDPEPGSYARSAWLRGLELERDGGFNPYRFGVIGSSDSHNSSSVVEEDNFTGGHGNADATPEVRLHSKPSTLTESSLNFSAAGVAGVWAESNTRESIFDALRRKETFATSGPRIRVRFFAGHDYPADLLERDDLLALAYRDGVPMGGDLAAGVEGSPRFLVWAMRDPKSGPLQRVQIVKGWVDAEGSHEIVHDVVCADGLTPDPETRRCPDNGATVDLSDCSFSTDRGAAELRALWADPEFDRSQRAFYYARVIENPTCRWSSWDAVRLGESPPAGVPPTIQERAWTSPIWLQPGS